jgi:hypothetical protein
MTKLVTIMISQQGDQVKSTHGRKVSEANNLFFESEVSSVMSSKARLDWRIGGL